VESKIAIAPAGIVAGIPESHLMILSVLLRGRFDAELTVLEEMP
jgi:hypothetical protein